MEDCIGNGLLIKYMRKKGLNNLITGILVIEDSWKGFTGMMNLFHVR
jgi:hypothetical protein